MILEGHLKTVTGIILMKPNYLLSVSEDGYIRGWNLENQAEEKFFSGHQKAIK
jgi:WD40 repeat protein